MTPLASSPAEARRLGGLGLVYLVALGLLVWLSIAFYRHSFADDVHVSLHARNAGQQLNVGGDVRMNGAIVGRVSGVQVGPDGADITLEIARSYADRIPADVQGRVLPTTLFGQKYVELLSPSDPAGDHLEDGSVVAEDRSVATVELTTVLDDLYPVLTAVRPDRLASTLGALANGLDGRGRQIRATAGGAGAYLRLLNARTPEFERDLRLFERVSGQYAGNADVLLRLLEHSTAISQSLTADRSALADFVASLTGASDAGRTLLAGASANLAESARLSRPTLELMARYSPELSCLVGGFLEVQRRSAAQIRGHRFQGYFTIGKQAGGYTAADRLKLGDLGTGPACRGLPLAPVPYGPVRLDDGVRR